MEYEWGFRTWQEGSHNWGTEKVYSEGPMSDEEVFDVIRRRYAVEGFERKLHGNFKVVAAERM